MKPRGKTSPDLLSLLKFARKQAAAAAKPNALKVFSKSLRELDRQANRIRRLATQGKVTPAVARKVLSKLDKSHQQVRRLMTAAAAQNKRTLAVLDRHLARAKATSRR